MQVKIKLAKQTNKQTKKKKKKKVDKTERNLRDAGWV